MDGLMCDMDGVLYRGDEVIEGAPEAIAAIKRAGIETLFCTNNARYTPDQYLEKLARLGFEIDRSELLTSAMVTAKVLASRGLKGSRALVIGGDGLEVALADEGITRTLPGEKDIDLVVVGWDPSFDYESMTAGARAVIDGATLIASNADATFPAPDGLLPGAGAIVASIERASGHEAEVIGKPHQPMMDAVQEHLAGARSIAAVGDRPDTDLDGARGKGWMTILVLSGVTSADAARKLEPAPDLVIESIADLPGYL
jgi:4-nitrophenyl phosphatase